MASFLRMVQRMLHGLAGLALALMVAIILMQVVLRYAFSSGVIWGEEVARIMMIAAALLGAALAHFRNGHIRFELLEESLPAWAQRILNIVSELVILIISLALLRAGYQLAELNAGQISLTTGISMSVIYSLVPISMGLLACASAVRLLGLVRSGGLDAEPENTP